MTSKPRPYTFYGAMTVYKQESLEKVDLVEPCLECDVDQKNQPPIVRRRTLLDSLFSIGLTMRRELLAIEATLELCGQVIAQIALNKTGSNSVFALRPKKIVSGGAAYCHAAVVKVCDEPFSVLNREAHFCQFLAHACESRVTSIL